MAIGIGFANDEYEKSIDDFYQEELDDAPIGAGGFVKDICYERAVEHYKSQYGKDKDTKEQGFI